MSQAATKDDLKNLGEGLRGEMHALGSNLRDEIKENTREIISHFNASQGEENQRLDRIETKVDATAEDVAKVNLPSLI